MQIFVRNAGMHVSIVEICAPIATMSAPTVCPFARVAMNVKIAEVISEIGRAHV